MFSLILGRGKIEYRKYKSSKTDTLLRMLLNVNLAKPAIILLGQVVL